MSPIAITLALAAALAGFAALAWRKLGLLPHLAPDPRWDDPLRRLSHVVENGFLQRRMIHGDRRPGVMHTVIFLGFMTLLVRKVQLVVIGYDETFVYPGLVGGVFAALKDVVELAVVGAVAYAFWRRFVEKPARLEPNREAIVVLSLIMAIMVTDFLFDGFRFAYYGGRDAGIAHEQSFAFVGSWIAALFSGLAPQTLAFGMHALYWVQMLTVLSFLVILPVGEHFHIVTALPALYFARGRPANRVPSVDLDKVMNAADGEEPKVGIRTARDLSWKDAFDAFTCTECGRCKDACPTFLTGKPLALKWVHDRVKHHLLRQRELLLADAGAEDELPALVPDVIGEDTLWACTTCGYCEAACPIELEHLPKFFALRQHRVMMEGAFPHELKTVFDAYEVQGNPWGLPSETRGDWARGLGVPVVTSKEEVERLDWLYYVGSAASFDLRGQKIAKAFVRVLQHAGVKVGILGPREGSTGECVRRVGNEMLYRTLADALAETLRELGVTRIVTTDPHAFNALRNEYPELGTTFEVVHHTQLLASLIADGRLALKAGTEERIVFHDPCYLGRHNGEYDAPRAVLARVASRGVGECELSRDRAMCCGAGGGRMWMEETIGTRINVARVKQALAQSPDVIATACPYCAVMISDGLKALGRYDDVKALDVVEIVAASLPAVVTDVASTT